jgi:hypothetical protein
MSHSFSAAYVRELEGFFDTHMAVLVRKIAHYASTGQEFDLKKALHYYVIDVLGEVAFSQGKISGRKLPLVSSNC